MKPHELGAAFRAAFWNRSQPASYLTLGYILASFCFTVGNMVGELPLWISGVHLGVGLVLGSVLGWDLYRSHKRLQQRLAELNEMHHRFKAAQSRVSEGAEETDLSPPDS